MFFFVDARRPFRPSSTNQTPIANLPDSLTVVDGVAYTWTRDDDRAILLYARQNALWLPDAAAAAQQTQQQQQQQQQQQSPASMPSRRALFGAASSATLGGAAAQSSTADPFAAWSALASSDAFRNQNRTARVLAIRCEKLIEMFVAKAVAK